jgi:hypothetical protein
MHSMNSHNTHRANLTHTTLKKNKKAKRHILEGSTPQKSYYLKPKSKFCLGWRHLKINSINNYTNVTIVLFINFVYGTYTMNSYNGVYFDSYISRPRHVNKYRALILFFPKLQRMK